MTELQKQYMGTRVHRCLADIATGSIVMRPSAGTHDIAYLRRGVVVREDVFGRGVMCGVVWDGFPTAFQYSDDTGFDVVQVSGE